MASVVASSPANGDGRAGGVFGVVSSSSVNGEADITFHDNLLVFTSRSSSLSCSSPPRSECSIKDETVVVVTRAEAETGNSSETTYTVYFLEPLENLDKSSNPEILRKLQSTALPELFIERHVLAKAPSYLTSENYKDGNGEFGRNIQVLVSTKSGTGLAESFYDTILREILEAIGLKLDVHYSVTKTETQESVKHYARTVMLPKANRGEPQTLVMLSGDGGVVDLINGLLGSDEKTRTFVRPTVCLLPLGTGNALFHSLHRPLDLSTSASSSSSSSSHGPALRTLLAGSPHPLPLFRGTFSPGARLLTDEARTQSPLERDGLYGAVVASYGFHATLVADSDTAEWRRFGAERFGMVAQQLLGSAPPGARGEDAPHAYRAEVTLRRRRRGGRHGAAAGAAADGVAATETTTATTAVARESSSEAEEEAVESVLVDRRTHGYVLATLVSNLERTFTISPASRLLDGQLRVVSFGNLGAKEVMEVMMKAYDGGKHVVAEDGGLPAVVGYEPVEGLRIDFREEGESARWRRVCVDGLIVQVEEGGWMDVAKVGGSGGAIDIVVLR